MHFAACFRSYRRSSWIPIALLVPVSLQFTLPARLYPCPPPNSLCFWLFLSNAKRRGDDRYRQINIQYNTTTSMITSLSLFICSYILKFFFFLCFAVKCNCNKTIRAIHFEVIIFYGKNNFKYSLYFQILLKKKK